MEVTARIFKASFSATANQWDITTEKLEFSVIYLIIEGYGTGDKRLGATIQIVKAENVIFILGKNRVTLKSWTRLKKEHLHDLYDPDKPRNLAKSVTVS